MSRVFEILNNKESFIEDDEVLVHFKNGEYNILYNNGKSLTQYIGESTQSEKEFVEYVRECYPRTKF